ncbi:unnamed protein product [Amoebophrya sp. A120]|nr:unnamed protein product [Amoebophrya sp. A120]|eukprot:GSA120T00014713001.1
MAMYLLHDDKIKYFCRTLEKSFARAFARVERSEPNVLRYFVPDPDDPTGKETAVGATARFAMANGVNNLSSFLILWAHDVVLEENPQKFFPNIYRRRREFLEVKIEGMNVELEVTPGNLLHGRVQMATLSLRLSMDPVVSGFGTGTTPAEK